jgi:hypothetical protein
VRLLRIDQIGSDPEGIESFVAQQRLRRLDVGRVALRDRNARALACECACAREPNALAAAGDQHDRCIQSHVHVV